MRDYPQWVAESTPPFFVPETSRAMMDWIGTVLQAPLPIALACSRALAAEDFRADMRRIEVPTLDPGDHQDLFAEFAEVALQTGATHEAELVREMMGPPKLDAKRSAAA